MELDALRLPSVVVAFAVRGPTPQLSADTLHMSVVATPSRGC